MKNHFLMAASALLFSFAVLWSPSLRAESQTNDSNEYKGITDPFGDPANYEFAEDEKEDKEFFHLGRFLMFGVDVGAGLFTGGLGSTNSPGFYVGAHLVYFFDRQLALELAGHYAFDVDSIKYQSGGYTDINTTLVPLTAGFRFYFDTQNAPKAIAVANPYLALGGGIYLRSQQVTADTGNSDKGAFSSTNASTGSFGAYGGGGVQFLIYKKHIFLGLDMRYNFIFFSDADSTINGLVPQGSRSGGYFNSVISMTYNF